ncbi:HAMP domain-containing sensor histidine kinase [Rhodococcus sp. HNM0569]|uniref:sensor histidine kinase n=1 Tax=Rhodococcus sp. HNM0569 TaxID=2716340 RepID=UPI00146A19A4|nr:HAMP domain-containing sensor histidine kinase [Rhodococcus sp. HNM0569]NLU82284.1 HAMP domain-containing histidine kinase [Rhodococcus sp. HNM0569]
MKNRLRALPLRFTLVAAVLVLTAAGLLASGAAVTSALENSLMSRVDAQLHDAAQGWAKPRDQHPVPPPDAPSLGRPPTPFFVQIADAAGEPLRTINDSDAEPALPDTPATSPTTVQSVGDSTPRWRVLSTTGADGTVTVAVTLTENDETVERLIGLELVIGAIVLVLLGVVGYFVVRRSLRPLAEVERTAAAIASGDLHRRVPERDSRTEVGRLTVALNGMLAQIQRAFAATEASEESARRSEDRMRRFVADASHELRTPLTTIRGFSELYRQGAMTDTDALMARIEGEASRMGLLVEDLLTLARLDSQRPLERAPVDLLAVASDAVHGARAVAPGRAISLVVLDGPGTAEVNGDDARLRQVLGNLLGNALAHTPESADVVVRLGTTERTVFFEVSDTGPGLSEEDAAHVFERFYRSDTSRARRSGGSGLGLSIVAALVAAHGGTVTVDSRPGEGATFRVELPR